jgi:formylglycine-generating enzyme required for sulfatase activity
MKHLIFSVVIVLLSVFACDYKPKPPTILADLMEQLDKPADVYPLPCPEGMVEIEGDYCPTVIQTCLRWIDHLRCAEFAKPSQCMSKRKHLHYCMSKFEYPGEGAYPIVGMDYYQAKAIAEKEGNRLCTEEEFNFACEGETMHPYGYGDGFHRDNQICNIDKRWIDYSLFSREDWNDQEMGLYQGVISDGKSLCRSVFGVYNLNGNVDEILDSEKHDNVVLSGGYWSTVRNRCRPKTIAHNKLFSFYNVGTRMCSDAPED